MTEYKDACPFSFGRWDKSIHTQEEQRIRYDRARHMEPFQTSDKKAKRGEYKGSGDTPYQVTLDSCTCPDFQERELPCKHMYRLALDTQPLWQRILHSKFSIVAVILFVFLLIRHPQSGTAAGGYAVWGVLLAVCIALAILFAKPKKLKEKKASISFQFDQINDRQPIRFQPLPIEMPPLRSFTVVGMNPKTGRSNTKHIVTKAEKTAIQKARESGLTDPFTVTVDYTQSGIIHNPPTDRQLEYAKDLGIIIPQGASLQNVSTMITRIQDEDMRSPTGDLAKYVLSFDDVEIDPYIGEKALVSFLISFLNDADLCVFYTYAVWCDLNGVQLGNPQTNPHYTALCRVGDRILQDEKLLRSVRNRPAEDYLKPNKSTAVYKAISFEVSRL